MKTAIVTGASRGIGKAIAEEFASLQYNVALLSRNRDEVREAAGEIIKTNKNVSVLSYECDIRSNKDVRETFDNIYNELSSIDVLVNNAGINSRKVLDTQDVNGWFENLEKNLLGWNDEIATNLTGVYICSYVAAGYMLKQKSGSIINISSVKGKEATSSPGYGASKAGVIKLTKDFAKVLAPYNIKVNCIAPGFIDTGLTSALPAEKKEKYKEMIPMKRFGSVEEIAKVAAFLASPDASYITGTTIDVNGGYLM